MTDVLVRLTTPSSGAAASGWVPADEVAAVGHLECRPYAPDADGARLHLEAPDRLLLPASMPPVRLVGGEALLHLAPTGAGWCWQIIERTPRGKTRYVLVPDSVAVLDYADLVDVDPATLAATAEPEAAWWTHSHAPAQIGTGTPTAGTYVDGGTGAWTPLPSGGGGGDTFGEGVVPIFETLAQAEAWEAANPGRVALTLEAAAEPDITPPSAGTLTMSQLGGTYMEATVSGASDDRGFVEYAFSRDNGATWTGWQASPVHMWTGLALSSSHTVTHRVRDQAGNTVAGATLPVTTLAADSEPQWGTRWHDDFTGDAPLVGRTMDAGGGTWQLLPGVTDPGWATTGGALPRTPESNLAPTAAAAATGLRGAGAMVTLPDAGVSRMRITIEGETSSAWGAIGFFFIDPSGTARFWLPRTAQAVLQTTERRLPGIYPGGPLLTAETIGREPVAINAERVLDITSEQITETIGGTLNVTLPLSGQYDFSQINQWGVYIARVSNNGVAGSIRAVTLRWE